ncbi:discoidin domain-containing protein (plasmid) [Bacillus sp. F19]|nr:discoidin domain-containing protein [Bacillus sp. F19]
MKKKVSALLAFVILLYSFSSTFVDVEFAASPVTITQVTQRPFIINDEGNLKSETKLTVNNPDSAFSAWVRITVTGKDPYMQSIGNLASGNNTPIVDVLELNNDGDNVTFEIFDNANGTGTPLATKTLPQNKVRHWKFFIAHDLHLDIGFTHYQEDLNNDILPGFLDTANSKIKETAGLPTNDQFRYPLETSFQYLDSAAKVRNADWIETFKQNVKSGNISYPSNYTNPVYEGLGTEQMARENYYSERIMKDVIGAESSKVLVKSDDSSISWSNIDANVQAGVKYGVIRANHANSTWSDNGGTDYYSSYPRLFYMQGRVPNNKILFYNHGKYSLDEFSFRSTDTTGNTTFNKIADKLMALQRGSSNPTDASSYPYDAVFEDTTNGGDNGGIVADVLNNIQKMNARTDGKGRKYVYPEYRSSDVGDFFRYIEENSDTTQIPAFKGTIEGSWNYGAGSTAYETAVNKENHDKLPAAEKFATWANMASAGRRYPFEKINDAYKKMSLYEEHTWDYWNTAHPTLNTNWKRDMSISSNKLSDSVLSSSLDAISTQIPTSGHTIAVYNSHSWTNSDIAKVNLKSLPAHFDIVDKETNSKVKYQKLSDGNVVFVAENVPGNGYKTFQVNSRSDDPVFTTSVVATSNTLENNYYKVKFDSSGSIYSIIDKVNGNKEMVDKTAPYKMNQFIFYTTPLQSSGVSSTNIVETAQLSSTTGGVMGVMTADGKPALGVSSLKRNVILYDSIPRIDIVNDVVKNPAIDISSQDEEAFFSFPMNVSTPVIRHEMPTGDVRPGVSSNINDPSTEQLYASMTDEYTVNRWIDVSNQSDYGITFSPINAPLVQYGERRSYKFDKDYDVRQKKPWIYSYVMNNKWHVNFPKSQPSPVSFKYSITSHGGKNWQAGRADKFGMQTSSGFKSTVIQNAQQGSYNGVKDQFIGIDQDNVVLTASKIAEDNGEGVILRFNETTGKNTRVTVDLGKLQASSVTKTDIVENDIATLPLKNNKVSFTIKGNDWFTIRVKQGTAPAQVTGVEATMDNRGTQLTWTDLKDSSLAYYEIFRSPDINFTPGMGSYLGSVSSNHFYDNQVMTGLTKKYYYKVRAVRAGAKGAFSNAVSPAAGAISDEQVPSTPELSMDFAVPGRVSISWTKSTDDVSVAGYKVYRDGIEIKDNPALLNSYLDYQVATGLHTYTVRAYDRDGKLSQMSDQVSALVDNEPNNIAPNATVTASTTSPSSIYEPINVTDGIKGISNVGEWASTTSKPWIKLTWDSTQKIGKIVLFDRNSRDHHANSGTLSFSDGSTIAVSGLPKNGTSKTIRFAPKEVTWVKFDVSGGTGTNVGLAEFQVFASTQHDVVPATLVAQWKLDEGSGITATDSTGNKNHTGTLINNPEWSASGKIDGALSFNGSNSKVDIGSSPALNETDAMTITGWFKTSQSASSGNVSIMSHNGHFTGLQLDGAGRGRAQYWIDGSPNTLSFDWTYSDNKWHHYAASYDKRKGMTLYVDGTRVAEDPMTLGALSTTTAHFELGNSETGNEAYNGMLDDVRVYRGALTHSEVQQLTVNKIPQSQMTATATSQETIGENNSASMAIDGDPQTFWHTKWDKSDVLPQSITLNLGGTYAIDKVAYLPRPSGSNGNITGYNVYVSTDGVTFTKVASGTWANNNEEKLATFDPTDASYVKLEATEGTGGWASAAEISVLRP